MSKFLFGLLVSVAAMVVSASAAGAGPPAIATGTWDCRNAASTITSDRTAGGNRIITWFRPGCVYAGDLTGTFTPHGTRIVRSDGSFTDHGGIVCTGCTLGAGPATSPAWNRFKGKGFPGIQEGSSPF
jgi:hypothetical protein